MRNDFILSLLFSAFVFATVACSSSKAPSPTALQTVQEIREKIQAQDFIVEVSSAQPMRGRTMHLTPGYSLQIRNDSAVAYLPFYGVAHSAPYGGEGGIRFSEAMKNYIVTEKKDNWEIRFKVNTRYYHYDISVGIYNNGNSTIHVASHERDPISFIGEMKMH